MSSYQTLRSLVLGTSLLASSSIFASSYSQTVKSHSQTIAPKAVETQIERTHPQKDSIEFLGLLNRASLGLNWKDLATTTDVVAQVETALNAGLSINSFGISKTDGKSVLFNNNNDVIKINQIDLDTLYLVYQKEIGNIHSEDLAISEESKQLFLKSFKNQIQGLHQLVLLPNGQISLGVSATYYPG